MNKFLVCVLTLLAASPLSAEMIGNVEYQLPSSAKNWVAGDPIVDKTNGKTQLYTPKELQPKHTQFFGVNANAFKTDMRDPAFLEESLKKQFPNQEVGLKLLEKDENSALYEWWIKDSGKEILHVWTRVFSTKDGTVVLVYQTDDIDNVDPTRNIWVPALKEAKLKE